MPSDLVDSVRRTLAEQDRAPTSAERALLIATVLRCDGTGRDVVDELQAARAALTGAYARSEESAARVRRLIRAVDAVLDSPPEPRAHRPYAPPSEERAWRADLDA